MLRNLDTIDYIARSSKNFSTEINFSENIFLVYRGGRPLPQLSGWYYFLASVDRPRTSPAKNPGTLRKCNSRWYRE
jgi:hypothetical protein